MRVRSGVTLRFETWNVKNRGQDPKIPTTQSNTLAVNKVAFRHPNGQFHGATNFAVKR